MKIEKAKEQKLCCVLNTSLSCESCGLIRCVNCGGWRYHKPIDSGGYTENYFNFYTCPTTHELVKADHSRKFGLKLVIQ